MQKIIQSYPNKILINQYKFFYIELIQISLMIHIARWSLILIIIFIDLCKNNITNSVKIIQSPFSNLFKIDNNRIQYIGQEVQLTQLIFNYTIQPNTFYTFSIKIQKSPQNVIVIGIIDYDELKNKRSSYSQIRDAVAYFSVGVRWPYGGITGGGFKQGQTVQVCVDRRNLQVTWNVNGKRRARYWHPGKLMPYVQMLHKNVVIQWVETTQCEKIQMFL